MGCIKYYWYNTSCTILHHTVGLVIKYLSRNLQQQLLDTLFTNMYISNLAKQVLFHEESSVRFSKQLKIYLSSDRGPANHYTLLTASDIKFFSSQTLSHLLTFAYKWIHSFIQSYWNPFLCSFCAIHLKTQKNMRACSAYLFVCPQQIRQQCHCQNFHSLLQTHSRCQVAFTHYQRKTHSVTLWLVYNNIVIIHNL